MYSSKYVAARLGMNNDTLRKWAIRYQLAPSARSTTGRYSYTDSDIVRLQMVLQLRQLGCALPDLAQMTLPQLAQKLPKSEKVAKQTLAIIGEPLSFTSQLLPLKLHYCELEMAMMLGLPTLMQCGSIGKHNLDAIFALRAATPSLLVCFRFANKSDRLALEAQGVETHSDPLEVKTVVAWLNNKIQNRQFSDPLLEKIHAWLGN